MRTRVKICGITTEADARMAIEAGADALGFNGWPGSKRFVDLRGAGEWISTLPPFVTRVALLVNASLSEALEITSLPWIDAVQLHGDEDADYCREVVRLGRPLIKALRIGTAEEIATAGKHHTRHVLIDAHVAGHFGGTGVQADFTLAQRLRINQPALHLTLAGGLQPENVGAAIRAVRPYAVDVSSGVESAPGRKDAGLVRAFIEAVSQERH